MFTSDSLILDFAEITRIPFLNERECVCVLTGQGGGEHRQSH